MRFFMTCTAVAFACLTSVAHAQGVPGMDMPGGDFGVVSANSVMACHNSCAGEPNCKAWTFKKSSKQCFLKNIVSDAVANSCCTSAPIDQFTKEQMRHEKDTDRFGADFHNMPASGPSDCERACMNERSCRSWSFVLATKPKEPGGCFLKDMVAQAVAKSGVISGVKYQRENF